MEQGRQKSELRRFLMEMLGCVLAAIGTYSFAITAGFPMAGFTGVAIIINRFTGFNVGLGLLLLNVPVALICYRLIGRRFFLHSLMNMLVVSMLMDFVLPFFPVYEGPRLLAAIACGVIAGAGWAIMFMQQASGGGAAFVAMAIKNQKPHLAVGRISLYIDIIPIIIGGILFWDIDGIIYGAIISFLYATMTDKLIYSANAGKLLLIISDKKEEVCQAIEAASGRGSTIWQAKGGYQGTEHQVIMCACDKTQTPKLQKSIEAADPGSFTVVIEAGQVAGRGFQRLNVGEKEEKGNAK